MNDSGKFMMMFPCYAIFANDCNGPLLGKSDSGIGLLLFTDEHQVERYRQDDGAVGPSIKFDQAGQVALFLDSLPQNITTVIIDPTLRRSDGGRGAHVVPFLTFVNEVMRMIQDGGAS